MQERLPYGLGRWKKYFQPIMDDSHHNIRGYIFVVPFAERTKHFELGLMRVFEDLNELVVTRTSVVAT
jgi:hypothetical protein